MLAVAQWITSSWSKDYRGGPRAELRNRVPEAESVELPDEWSSTAPLIVHGVYFGFHRTWSKAYEQSRHEETQGASLAERVDLGSVWLRLENERLYVDYHWTRDTGAPERYTRRNLLELSPGQWGRVRYNARISRCWDQSEWYYNKRVFNIGLFEILDPRVFLNTEPVKVHSDMAQLWQSERAQEFRLRARNPRACLRDALYFRAAPPPP